MKITGFNPIVVTQDVEKTVEVFEALGFKKTHNPTGMSSENLTDIVLEDANGNKVDIAPSPQPHDVTILRMNVDNLEEAYNLLLSKGFVNTRGEGFVETEWSKAATMVSPTGYIISIGQHFKK